MDVLPAILEADAAAIQAKLDQLTELGSVPAVQLDVTDGTLTEQMSWHDPADLPSLGWAGEFELHLMEAQPPLVDWLADSRVTRCIVHAEANDPTNLLQVTRARGRRVGLALHPDTSVEEVGRYVPLADYVVLLTVRPGAQGQPFLGHVLLKVERLRSLHPGVPVYVDGGINPHTLERAASAGCSGAAVGSYLWRSESLAEAWESLASIAS